MREAAHQRIRATAVAVHLDGEVEVLRMRGGQELRPGRLISPLLGQGGVAGEGQKVVDVVRVAGCEVARPGQADQRQARPRHGAAQGTQGRYGAQHVAELEGAKDRN